MSRSLTQRNGRWLGAAVLSIGLLSIGVVGAVASSAGAQPQPPPGQPGQPPPGQPAPGQPPRPIQIQPVQPGQLPPGMQPRQPGQPGQPGQLPPGMQPRRPGGPPGAPGGPGGRPGMPPGHPPIPGQNPPAEPESAHGGGEHECAGHGPNDAPPHINWYQGLLGINNEKSQKGSGLDKLLWRYHNDIDECDHLNQEPPVLASLINFGVMLFLLFSYGRGPLRDGLQKRKKDIMQDIDAAAQLRREAEARLEKYQQQLSNVEDRRKELEADLRAQFESEKTRIISEAEEKRARMRKDAEFRIAQELRQAEADLLQESVDGAIRAAEELLKKKVQQADQDRLADDYAASIGAALKASSGPSTPRNDSSRGAS